jgi:hypothetical protein
MELPKELINAARKGKLVPFIGAGLPKNLGMPLWNDLVAHIGKELGFDPPELIAELGDALQVAEYYTTYLKDEGPLYLLLADLLRVPPSELGDWRAYEALLNLNPKIIYTTNFDLSIETFYERNGQAIHSVSKVEHLFNQPPDVPILVHFHGDVRHHGTVVLGESHYLNRLELESPLDIKFRSDLLQNRFVFLGYGYTDFNIRYIWHKLQMHLYPYRSKYAETSDSYFVTSRRNEIFETIMRPKGMHLIHVPIQKIEDTIPTFLQTVLAKL